MLEIIPETQIRQKDCERENSKLGKKVSRTTLIKQHLPKYPSTEVGKPNALEVLKEFPTQILPNQEKERTF